MEIGNTPKLSGTAAQSGRSNKQTRAEDKGQSNAASSKSSQLSQSVAVTREASVAVQSLARGNAPERQKPLNADSVDQFARELGQSISSDKETALNAQNLDESRVDSLLEAD